MGFSVSGAAAIIFLSLFIAFGTMYTAADNSFHEVVDAQDDRTEGTLETKNTAIELSSAVYDSSPDPDEVTITANNTGSTTLSLEATTLLIDNTFEGGWEAGATVDGNGATDLWAPGETLTVTVTVSSQPARVTLATDSGVSVTVEVEQ